MRAPPIRAQWQMSRRHPRVSLRMTLRASWSERLSSSRQTLTAASNRSPGRSGALTLKLLRSCAAMMNAARYAFIFRAQAIGSPPPVRPLDKPHG